MAESLDFWLHRLECRHPKSIDLGLDRCSRVYRTMGSPRPAPLVITVAGTNGKGSTVAYISTILSALGYRCGTYTSPHLLRFNERVQIDGLDTDDVRWITAFENTEAARKDVSLTYFEFTSLAAFQILHEASLDAVVLEVGLGGRLDTVNLVDPDCAVIMPIGLDHQDYLGADRETIGFEKAGIMRPGIPVVCGDRDPPLSLISQAREMGVCLSTLGIDFDWSLNGSRMRLAIAEKDIEISCPEMKGVHQLDNLSTAVAALHCLLPEALENNQLWSTSPAQVRVPGRLERIESDPRFIVDVGHNPMAAEVVAAHLQTITTGRVFCVLGMFKDKDAEQFVHNLNGQVDFWFCAGLVGSRGQGGSELGARISTAIPGADISVFETVSDAIVEAMGSAGSNDCVLVTGSFETAAQAFRIFARKDPANI
ncbi:MAG: dihydrofolate synthase/folylpolyglutamate synthase [Lysobacterales bacterium]|jgi:dihydrofolate synthase/folylpolyglutamate synthase